MAFKGGHRTCAGIACCRRRRCCGFGASAMAQFSYSFVVLAHNRRQRLEKEIDQQQKRRPNDDRARKRLWFFLEPIFPFSFFFGIVPPPRKKNVPMAALPLGANLRMKAHTHTPTQKKRQHNGLCRALPFFFLALCFWAPRSLCFAGRPYATSDNQRVGEKKFVETLQQTKKDGQTRRRACFGFLGDSFKTTFYSSFCPQCAPRPQKSAQASGEGKEKKGDTMGDQQGQPTVGRFF
ncbi:hypothetical protein TW95_gp1568 [Pandoravirus inopinatum]|uniref:Transmembrane protein n=1 Tax=Pandoravirus inopinatum TaxID=1605721 RepID=A0A0B5JET1_9VIRU|nr:hypothetical protein TW95_gp1568 [Pandoravirus inopinatum]AJF98302.1 hypothetical protein [Pandoravirus inopinatum]